MNPTRMSPTKRDRLADVFCITTCLRNTKTHLCSNRNYLRFYRHSPQLHSLKNSSPTYDSPCNLLPQEKPTSLSHGNQFRCDVRHLRGHLRPRRHRDRPSPPLGQPLELHRARLRRDIPRIVNLRALPLEILQVLQLPPCHNRQVPLQALPLHLLRFVPHRDLGHPARSLPVAKGRRAGSVQRPATGAGPRSLLLRCAEM